MRAVSRRRGPERRDPIPSPPPRVLRAAGGPARTCQYIGDAKGNARDWAVCGKRPVAGRSYCQEHVEIWCARRTGRRLGVQVPRNEGVTKPRFSASRALAPARGQAKRRQRHGWAGLLSTVKAMVRGAEAFRSVEGNIAGVVLVRCRRAPRCQRTHARSHAFCWDPGRSSNCPGCRRGAA